MTIYHPQMANGGWQKYSLVEQMANIGSEVFRAISWRKKDQELSQSAFGRSLELFDLTIADPKNKKRLKEICRARELWADYFVGDNQYHFTSDWWQKYFYQFNWVARI